MGEASGAGRVLTSIEGARAHHLEHIRVISQHIKLLLDHIVLVLLTEDLGAELVVRFYFCARCTKMGEISVRGDRKDRLLGRLDTNGSS